MEAQQPGIVMKVVTQPSILHSYFHDNHKFHKLPDGESQLRLLHCSGRQEQIRFVPILPVQGSRL